MEAGAQSGIDGVYFSLHGAMGAEGELDPEGYLLQETRRLVGAQTPIVISQCSEIAANDWQWREQKLTRQDSSLASW